MPCSNSAILIAGTIDIHRGNTDSNKQTCENRGPVYHPLIVTAEETFTANPCRMSRPTHVVSM